MSKKVNERGLLCETCIYPDMANQMQLADGYGSTTKQINDWLITT